MLSSLAEREGRQTREKALRRVEIFHRVGLDYILEGREAQRRWHNKKYFTWVEQQGKTVKELDAQRSDGWWHDQAAMAEQIDKRLLDARG